MGLEIDVSIGNVKFPVQYSEYVMKHEPNSDFLVFQIVFSLYHPYLFCYLDLFLFIICCYNYVSLTPLLFFLMSTPISCMPSHSTVMHTFLRFTALFLLDGQYLRNIDVGLIPNSVVFTFVYLFLAVFNSSFFFSVVVVHCVCFVH